MKCCALIFETFRDFEKNVQSGKPGSKSSDFLTILERFRIASVTSLSRRSADIFAIFGFSLRLIELHIFLLGNQLPIWFWFKAKFVF